MLLHKITVENFRGIRRIDVEIDRTTVLVGENNSGKSTFIDAIRLCLDRALSRRSGGSNVFDDYDHHVSDPSAPLADTPPVVITLTFAERKRDEWLEPVAQKLNDLITFDNEGLRHVVLRVTCRFDRTIGDFLSDVDFLTFDGQALPPNKSKKPQNLVILQQLVPVFYLSALRDAGKEFQPRGTLWGRFLRNPSIPPEVRIELERELAELNAKIVGAEPRLAKLQETLEKAARVVQLADGNPVTIDALPASLWETLTRAQVSIAAPTGVQLPLQRHGSGTQSLTVIYLFEAFLSVMLAQAYDANSKPILMIEEPEAHLHPSAVRGLWRSISAMEQQMVVATHSGDLLAEVSLRSVRRFYRKDGDVRVGRLGPNTLTVEDARKLDLHVRRTRGELLFARCWLLVEGQTEYWVFWEAARFLGFDLELSGARIVPFVPAGGVCPLVKLADDLGIQWHCVVDGDQAGAGYTRSLRPILNGRSESDYITTLPQRTIEVHLCENGLGDAYLPFVSPQKTGNITCKKGDADYWSQVVSSLGNTSKEEMAINAMAHMVRSRVVPPLLNTVVERVRALTEG